MCHHYIYSMRMDLNSSRTCLYSLHRIMTSFKGDLSLSKVRRFVLLILAFCFDNNLPVSEKYHYLPFLLTSSMLSKYDLLLHICTIYLCYFDFYFFIITISEFLCIISFIFLTWFLYVKLQFLEKLVLDFL